MAEAAKHTYVLEHNVVCRMRRMYIPFSLFFRQLYSRISCE